MAEHVPGIRESFRFAILNPDGTNFGEGTKLRAAARPTLQPNNKRDFLIFLHDIMHHGPE